MMDHGNAQSASHATLKPALYVVATPIGNLRDVTLRALDVLRDAQVIAAEDTRVTSRLLNHYGIRTRLLSAHAHNERRVSAEIVGMIETGAAVALVSDAGTPAISDPGARIVAAVRAAGLAVVPVPGPCAAAAALSASGFEAPQFLFFGFLPARSGERRRKLAAICALPYTLVFHEAPHRAAETVSDLSVVLGGERRVLIARELTKLFESVHACRLQEARAWMDSDAHNTRGEFVLVVEGAPCESRPARDDADHVLECLLAALPLKQAAVLGSSITGVSRKRLYARALELRPAR